MKEAPTPESPEQTESLRQLEESILEGGVLLLSLLCGFLLFVCAPLLGKTIQFLGVGAPGEWQSCLVSLLIGAVGGLWLASRLAVTPLNVQLTATGLWAVLAIVACEAIPHGSELAGGTTFALLALKFLPSIALLAGLPRLFTSWRPFNQAPSSPKPSTLFVVGALICLASYPLWIEPVLPLSEQVVLWELGVILVVFLSLLTGLLRRHLGSQETTDGLAGAWVRSPSALLAAALGAAVVLSGTELLAQELGTSAFACGLPACLFLIGWVCIPGGMKPRLLVPIGTGLLLLSLGAYHISRGLGPVPLDGSRLAWFLLVEFSAGFLCKTLLDARQSTAPLAADYRWEGLAALLGAVCAVYLMPSLLAWSGDLPLLSLALLLVGFGVILKNRSVSLYVAVSLTCVIPATYLAYVQTRPAEDEKDTHTLRTGQGVLIIHKSPVGVVLSTQSTTLATQITQEPEALDVPTLYASQNSGIGQCISTLQEESPALRMAVFGLGGGTLAAFARPDDQIVFWETDPSMIQASQEDLHYLRRCKGHLALHSGNGRLGLRTQGGPFDLIVINAGLGDAPPSSLLTKEALREYSTKLSSRGLVVFNNSSRYHDAFPVLWSTAIKLGWSCFQIQTDITEAGPLKDYDPCNSHYVVMGPPGAVDTLLNQLEQSASEERIQRTITKEPATREGVEKGWSDGTDSPFAALRMDRLLVGSE